MCHNKVYSCSFMSSYITTNIGGQYSGVVLSKDLGMRLPTPLQRFMA